jgi:hypothetical protein
MHIYIHMHTYVYMNICVCIYIHTHTHTHTYVYIYVFLKKKAFFLYVYTCIAGGLMGLNLDTRGGQLAMREVILPGRKVHILTQLLLLYW